MSGTREGGALAAQTNKTKYGENFYKEIGSIGGKKKVPKGFALMTPEKRKEAGRVGGTRSKRGASHRKDNMGEEATVSQGRVLQNESNSGRKRSLWIFGHKG